MAIADLFRFLPFNLALSNLSADEMLVGFGDRLLERRLDGFDVDLALQRVEQLVDLCLAHQLDHAAVGKDERPDAAKLGIGDRHRHALKAARIGVARLFFFL